MNTELCYDGCIKCEWSVVPKEYNLKPITLDAVRIYLKVVGVDLKLPTNLYHLKPLVNGLN